MRPTEAHAIRWTYATDYEKHADGLKEARRAQVALVTREQYDIFIHAAEARGRAQGLEEAAKIAEGQWRPESNTLSERYRTHQEIAAAIRMLPRDTGARHATD